MKYSGTSLAELCNRGARIFKSYGFKYFIQRIWKYLRRRGWRSVAAGEDLNTQYRKWLAKTKGKQRDVSQINPDVETSKISIILPVVNPDTYSLQKAIESLIDQTSPYWDLYLVHGISSEEKVIELLNKLAAKDNRFNIIRHYEEQGRTKALNNLIAEINTEYLLFMSPEGVLHPWALTFFQQAIKEDRGLDFLYGDEDSLDEGSRERVQPWFKPEWSPYLLHSFNYVGYPLVIRKNLFEQVGGFREGYENCDTYDLLLRMTDLPLKVKRIPDILFSRIISNSITDQLTLEKAVNESSMAVKESLARKGYTASVEYSPSKGVFSYRVSINKSDKISIIIPTKDNGEVLQRCLESILNKSTYCNYELIIIDNGSTDSLTLDYLASLENKKLIHVLRYPGEFNYPLINNFGAAGAAGRHLVFLNDDTEILSSDWLEAMLEFSQMSDVGAVGGLLLFPNELIQHAGIVLGIRGSASHAFYKCEEGHEGFYRLLNCVRNVSAVTAACMMIEKEKFLRVGGFDAKFKVGMNDVDLCLRLNQQGYQNIYTPHVRLMHYESLTRGEYVVQAELDLFVTVYRDKINLGDPYYHPYLSLERNDYSLAV
ncbi:MAG: hypothetical protein CVV03_00645 [Firmicutes bacterium HGW-Firmicutes-8]|nr:MAG: hypothetical protein CVV03_00645 [Firmicutes bacterium HGW-Firmicutes-8]